MVSWHRSKQSRRWPYFLLALLGAATVAPQLAAATWDPAAPDYSGNKGKTFYVSKLGDNTDGSTWAKAFHTIQAALLAVPDDKGGHRIVVRPDTYVEANLYTAHKGAPGAYNLLIGDSDGSLGSGAIGRIVIDSGDPEKGFKSYDFWSTIRATQKGWSPKHTAPTFSSICWDRWMLRNLYATGSDAGLFWDLADKSGEGFTVIVEDCVGIGRAFGGGFSYQVTREKEPIVFRRCYLASLDWWGDAGGLAVGAYNKSPPKHPDAICEDCTFVGPDNAVQITFPSKYIRLKMKNCRLITLNFSQPHGTPSSGIISSIVPDPEQVHIDFEDCTLMGYKVFGTCDEKINKAKGVGAGQISYTTKGKVRAYVQYEQTVPKGFERLGLWPTEVFDWIAPPKPGPGLPAAPKKLTKLPENLNFNPEKVGVEMESTPIVFQGRQLLFITHRVDTPKPDLNQMYLLIRDPATGKEVARFGRRHSLGSAFVESDTVHVFASEHGEKLDQWFGDIYHFSSTDLKSWKRELAIRRVGGEHLLNSSVCREEQGYLMAYESDVPVAFCFKFARSKDLAKWEKIDGLVFAGVRGKEYSACPVIRYYKPYYYAIYLHAPIPGHNGWVSFLARSKNLAAWQLSPKNPILEAGEGEGCNNSDVDLIEIDGKTYVYYCTGDQQTWGELRRAVYPGPMKVFWESYFPEGAQMTGVSARNVPPAN
ncbi:MAG: hypothetical protein KKE86_16285 [Planctomycetes bacterium]|nr:hypothetical protein [Planctomycetota bacterium]MCG2684738.1 hypothetical protein [Planctomycetales bacterium]